MEIKYDICYVTLNKYVICYITYKHCSDIVVLSIISEKCVCCVVESSKGVSS